jgi:hypothetical protein
MTNQNNDQSAEESVINRGHARSISNRVDLKKSDHVLTVDIYPVDKFIDQLDQKEKSLASGCLVALLALFIPSLIIINLLMVIIVTLILYHAIFKFAFLALFLLVPLFFPLRFTMDANYFFISEFTKVRLVINDRNFSLDWDFLGIKRHKSGQTQDLRSAKVVDFKTLKKIAFQTQLCLTQGTYKHKFGYGLLSSEHEWLAEEINSFLETRRSR